MNDKYKGLYFPDRKSDGPQKVFYEHGAHFEYKALYLILEEITKKIKPKINSSIPKKKNISLNKKRATSCNKKKVSTISKNKKQDNKIIKNNIKTDKINYNKTKKSNNNNNKYSNNSLNLKKNGSKNVSCQKNKKLKKYLIGLKKSNINDKSPRHSNKKTNLIKYNSSIINNSMDYCYNNKYVNSNESMNSYYNNNNKNSNSSLYNAHPGKKYLKFNAIPLSDFSKKNDNIILTYNTKKNKINNKTKTNKKKLNTEKNNNLITKDNKNKNKTKSISDFINEPINIINDKKMDKSLMNNKMNNTETNFFALKSGTNNNNYNYKKRKNNFDYSFNIKTPKCNYNVKTNNKNIYKYNIKKIAQQMISGNLNKTSINTHLKQQKCSKNLEKFKNKLSRNNVNCQTENSFYNNKKNNFQLTFHNYKNDNLIKNYIFNYDNSEIIKEKKKRKKLAHSIERKDIRKDIKKKLLQKNKLSLEIKDKIINLRIPESTKNYSQKKFNKNSTESNNDEKYNIIYNNYQNCIYTESNKSNNDSTNK